MTISTNCEHCGRRELKPGGPFPPHLSWCPRAFRSDDEWRAKLTADARLLWAMRVLDRWAAHWECAAPSPVPTDGMFVVAWISDRDGIVEDCEALGLTPNEARIVAAESIARSEPAFAVDP